MGLPRVIQTEKFADLILREDEAKLFLDELKPRHDLAYAVAVAQRNQVLHVPGIGIVAVPKDVVLTLFILAGKLRARNEQRGVVLQYLSDGFAPLYGVVVRHREQVDSRALHLAYYFKGAVRSIGYGGMHMKIYPADFIHRKTSLELYLFL